MMRCSVILRSEATKNLLSWNEKPPEQILRGACPERTRTWKQREQIPRFARDDRGKRGAQDDNEGAKG